MTSTASRRTRALFAIVIAIFTVSAFALLLGKNSGQEQSSDRLTTAEVDFLTMMIPHHQQAIEMADLVPTRSSDSEVIELARQIKEAQGPEIEQMRALLLEFGIEENPSSHAAHMHGMLDEDEMKALAEASGDDFDRLFLDGMIKHHEGAIDMVALVGDSTRLSSLGKTIFSAQNTEIAQMQEMLARKG